VGGTEARRRAMQWEAVESRVEWSVHEEEGKWEMSPLCWATREQVTAIPHGAVATGGVR
jgi:hypothetical protein